MFSNKSGVFVWVSMMSVAVVLLLFGGCSVAPRYEASQILQRAGVVDAIVFECGDAVDIAVDVPETLTLQEAIRRALVCDPELQAAINRVRIAEAEANQARLLPNPILSMAFRFPEGSLKPVVVVDLAAELIAVLQMPGRVSAADSRLRSTVADAVSTVLDLIAEMEEHYLAVQMIDALLPILQERVELVEDEEMEKLELAIELRERQLEQTQAQLAIARLIGQPSRDINWKVEPWQKPAKVTESEAAWVAAALAHRPEIESLRWELTALGAERRLANFSPFEAVEVGAAAERGDKWDRGPAFTAPIPIFDWGQSQRARAAVAEAEARNNLLQAQRQVVQEVREAYAAVQAFTEVAELASEADQELLAVREKVIDLEHKALVALSKLRRAVGGAEKK